jgi:hypothetical protein
MKTSVPGEPVTLEAKFTTLTPCFSHYQLEIDGKQVPVEGDVYEWKLKKGTNSLKIASINAAGRSGFPSDFILEYNPDSVDYSKPVTVELKNHGMENTAGGSTKGNLVPANWGAITSNALRFREFTLDSGVKHSGKYSLRAAPARDPKTDIEYAFIVKSDNFAINPAADVIYSIWLRAAEDNTPVDIGLLDSTYKGQGTYIERVTVGKTWKKYELKCRIHNEITQAYIAFKVYTGTVWADDVSYLEVKKH